MKYVRKFESFRSQNSVNEELLGGLVNWFKKMWDSAVQEIEKIDNDPNKIKEWVMNNALNPKDNTNIFSEVIKEFNKKQTANDQDCLTLVDNLIDPETGSLGKQGIGVLLNNKIMLGEKLKSKRAMLEFIINTARNKTIFDSKVKFAGGPTDGKVDPKKKNIDLKDTTHLPEFKKILIAQKDEKKKKEEAIKWVTSILIPLIQNHVKSIKEDDIRESLDKQGIDLPETVEYKEGDSVIYLKDGKTREEWDKLSDDQKSKTNESPAKDLVGIKKIEKVDGDNITFKDKDGKDFIKTKDEIISMGEDKGPNAQELAKSLGEIKSDEDKMKKVNDFTNFIKDPANKDKADQISKIMGEE